MKSTLYSVLTVLLLCGCFRAAPAMTGPEPPAWESELQAGREILESLDPEAVSKAESHFRKALVLSEKEGASPSSRAEILDALGRSLYFSEDMAAAEETITQALRLKREALGSDHPAVARTLLHLAALEGARKDPKSAEKLMLQALEIQKKSLDAGHPDRIETLLLLGAYYQGIGGQDYARAEVYYLEALQEQDSTPGVDHPDFGATLNMLIELYKLMGQDKKREHIEQRIDQYIWREDDKPVPGSPQSR